MGSCRWGAYSGTAETISLRLRPLGPIHSTNPAVPSAKLARSIARGRVGRCIVAESHQRESRDVTISTEYDLGGARPADVDRRRAISGRVHTGQEGPLRIPQLDYGGVSCRGRGYQSADDQVANIVADHRRAAIGKVRDAFHIP
jgi:hypothetical protein